MKTACEDCVYWEPSRERDCNGFCQRYAPSRPTPSARTVDGVHLSELWPVTGRGARCGEFQAWPPKYPECAESRALVPEHMMDRPAGMPLIFLTAKAVAPLTDSLQWEMACTRAIGQPSFVDRQITRSLLGNPWIFAQSLDCGQPVTIAMQVKEMAFDGIRWGLALQPNVTEAEWRAFTDAQRQRYHPSEALLLVSPVL